MGACLRLRVRLSIARPAWYGRAMPAPDTGSRETRIDPATGCLLWLGPVSKNSCIVWLNRKPIQARRWMAERWHRHGLPQVHVEAICARAAGKRGTSLCVSPHHAVARSPVRLADRLKLSRASARAMRDAMRHLGETVPDYPLRWDVTNTRDGLRCSVEELERFSVDHAIPYWAAWGTWSTLCRDTWREKIHIPNLKRQALADDGGREGSNET